VHPRAGGVKRVEKGLSGVLVRLPPARSGRRQEQGILVLGEPRRPEAAGSMAAAVRRKDELLHRGGNSSMEREGRPSPG
jgi:hypothetical protein